MRQIVGVQVPPGRTFRRPHAHSRIQVMARCRQGRCPCPRARLPDPTSERPPRQVGRPDCHCVGLGFHDTGGRRSSSRTFRELGQPDHAIAAFEGWNVTPGIAAVVEHPMSLLVPRRSPRSIPIGTTTRLPGSGPGSSSTVDRAGSSLCTHLHPHRHRHADRPRRCRAHPRVEPSFRWRAFAIELMEFAQTADVQLVLTLGALMADVAHSRLIPVTVPPTRRRCAIASTPR